MAPPEVVIGGEEPSDTRNAQGAAADDTGGAQIVDPSARVGGRGSVTVESTAGTATSVSRRSGGSATRFHHGA